MSDLNKMSDPKVHVFAVSVSPGEGKQRHARKCCHAIEVRLARATGPCHGGQILKLAWEEA